MIKQMMSYKLRRDRRSQLEAKTRQIGHPVRRALRKINGKLYIINISKRREGHSFNLTFDLMPYTDSKPDRRNNLQKSRGFYLLDPTLMLNIGQQNIYDYLMDQIYLENNVIQFRPSEFHNVDDIKELAVDRSQSLFAGRGTIRIPTVVQETQMAPLTFLD